MRSGRPSHLGILVLLQPAVAVVAIAVLASPLKALAIPPDNVGAEIKEDLLGVRADNYAGDSRRPGRGGSGSARRGLPEPRFVLVRQVVGDSYQSSSCMGGRAWAEVEYAEFDRWTGQRTPKWRGVQCIPYSAQRPDAPAPDFVDIEGAIHDEMLKRLPRPVVDVNPDQRGLTGLETHFWYADNSASGLEPVDHDGNPATPPVPGLEVTANAGPYAITGRVAITRYQWRISPARGPGAGRDRATLTSTTPGSPERPAARYLFDTKGRYTLTAETVWAGSYTWTAPGQQGSGSLGEVPLSASRDYEVIEVRSVLVK
ncbi:MAG: hypothetical protein M3O70_22590 [Actinomycetota bacterium]|nr:hypothetical protein [Actinomycetota bacterium]